MMMDGTHIQRDVCTTMQKVRLYPLSSQICFDLVLSSGGIINRNSYQILGGGLHLSTASKTNRRKSDTYAICKRDVTMPAPLVTYYATVLGGKCPQGELIASAEECSNAYMQARQIWSPTILSGKQGKDELDMHKNDVGWDAYPVCLRHCNKTFPHWIFVAISKLVYSALKYSLMFFVMFMAYVL